MTANTSQPVRINHDIHVHTFLSACSKDEQAVPATMLARAAEQGIDIIGFADHLWDAAVPGPSKWYARQDLEHLLQIRRQLPNDTHGVHVLVGCETEYCGRGKIGLSRANAEQLDFVLVPISHFHMKGFVVQPEEIDSLPRVAATLVQRFLEVVELGLATGIAHPFLTLGFFEHTDTIIQHISDQAFSDCFGRAAELGISIEIHPKFFPSASGGEQPGHHDDTFLRVLSLAKSCGCVFHCASDTHTLDGIGRVHLMQPYLTSLGITSNDFLPLVRPRSA